MHGGGMNVTNKTVIHCLYAGAVALWLTAALSENGWMTIPAFIFAYTGMILSNGRRSL